jgi:hypothetical protein
MLKQMQNPDALTISGRFNYNYHKYFNNKHLIPAKDDQFTPEKDDQSHGPHLSGVI